MSDDVIRYLIIGSVWLVAGALFVWACGGAAKLGGPEDSRKEKSRLATRLSTINSLTERR